ncbi:MAG TPA: hypothetical protein VFZ83_05660, partial [Acidimicrobiia bacterium]|nr:hypothetical protein [Acidimicrobiia bacterium]
MGGAPSDVRGVTGAQHRSGRFRALGWDFAVEADDALLVEHVDRTCAALAEPGDAEHLYTISR